MTDPDAMMAHAPGVRLDGPIETKPATPDPLAHLRARDYVSIQVRDFRRILRANEDHATGEAKYRDASVRWRVVAYAAAVVALVMDTLLVGVLVG